MAVETRVTAFQSAQQRFDAAAEVIGLSDDARRGLREVKRELTVHFPVRLDNGGVQVFTGWRVQHNISRGPAKGGIRYHPLVTLDLVKALVGTLKGSPFGRPAYEELFKCLYDLLRIARRDGMRVLRM